MNFLFSIVTEQTVRLIGWVLVHFLWQGLAAMALMWCVLNMLAKSSAHVRYITTCAGLVLMTAAPIATFVVIAPDMPVPAVFNAAPAEDLTLPVRLESLSKPDFINTSEPTAPPKRPLMKVLSTQLDASLPWCVAGWAVGAASLSLWYLGGWYKLQQLRRNGTKRVLENVEATVSLLSQRLGIRQAVRIVESALVQVPTVIGWLKPIILLPATALTGLDEIQLQAMIAHELAHIKRCDYIINIMQTAVEILGFYHPAVWWMSKQIRIERENCCDDMAVNLIQNRKDYAGALFTMETIRRKQLDLAIAANGSSLPARIRRLSGHTETQRPIGWIPSILTILFLAIILITTSKAMSNKPVQPQDFRTGTKSTLEFRLVATPEQAEGIDVLNSPLAGYEWLPLKNPSDNTWLNNMPQRKGQAGNEVQLLVSNQKSESMLADGSWGIEKAVVSTDNLGNPAVEIFFDAPAREKFYTLTKNHIQRHLAICIDGKIYSAPRIMTAIRSAAIITGSFTKEEAQTLAEGLAKGMPPVSSNQPVNTGDDNADYAFAIYKVIGHENAPSFNNSRDTEKRSILFSEANQGKDRFDAMRPENYPLDGLIVDKEPIFTEKDIVTYDWEKHIIRLTPSVRGRLPNPSVWGVPFVVIVHGQRIYLGAFWTGASSYMANMPTISLDSWFANLPEDDPMYLPNNAIRIGGSFVIREEQVLTKPQNDERIRNSLEMAGKLLSPPAAGGTPDGNERKATINGQVLDGNGRPAANQKVELQVFIGGDADDEKNYRRSNEISDSEGKFTFKNIEPGSAHIGRFFQSEDIAGVPYGLSHPFEIQSGQVYTITLGGQGRPVIGRLVPASGNTKDIDWSQATVLLDLEAAPWSMGFGEDNSKLYRAMVESDGRDFYSRQGIKIEDDGTFRIDNVRAGRYMFRVKLPDGTDGFNLFHEFTVELMDNGTDSTALNLGDLIVRHGNYVAPIQPATDGSVDGSMVRETMSRSNVANNGVDGQPQVLIRGYLAEVPSNWPKLQELAPKNTSVPPILTSEELDAFIKTVEQLPDAVVLSRPAILTNNNQAAEMLIGDIENHIKMNSTCHVGPDRQTIRLEVQFELARTGLSTMSLDTNVAIQPNHAVVISGIKDENTTILLLLQARIREQGGQERAQSTTSTALKLDNLLIVSDGNSTTPVQPAAASGVSRTLAPEIEEVLLRQRVLLQETLAQAEMEYKAGLSGPEAVLQAKLNLLQVENQLAGTQEKRIEVLQEIVNFLKQHEQDIQQRFEYGVSTSTALNEAKLRRLEAEKALLEASNRSDALQTSGETPSREVDFPEMDPDVLFHRYITEGFGDVRDDESGIALFNYAKSYEWKDIPLLLEFASSTKLVSPAPSQVYSSYHQRNAFEGMIALWLIESVRRQQSGGRGPLNPLCIPADKDELKQEWETSKVIHQQILAVYQMWWQNAAQMPADQAAQIDPMQGSAWRWFGYPLRHSTDAAETQLPWGEAVEGVTIGIIEAGQVTRPDGRYPTVRLRLAARNDGQRYLHLPENGLSWQIEVNGEWYEWVDPRLLEPSIETQNSFDLSSGGILRDFNAGHSYSDLVIEVGGNWRKIPAGQETEFAQRRYGSGWAVQNDDYGEELVFHAGRTYRIHVAIPCPPSRAGRYDIVRPVSKPVEVTIRSTSETIENAVSWGEAVEGMSVRLHSPEVKWFDNQWEIYFKTDLKSETERLLPHYGAPLDDFYVEVDGRRYRKIETLFDARSVGPSLATQRENLHTSVIARHWRAMSGESMPEYTPGRHTIRILFPLGGDLNGGEVLFAFSNPVEVDIPQSPLAAK